MTGKKGASRFKGSGAKSAGRSNKKMGGKDMTKQFMIERKDNEKKLKKAIDHTEKKFIKKVDRVEHMIDPAI